MWDAFRRALQDGLQPKVWMWSLLPLVVVAVLAAMAGWWWWDGAVQSVQQWLGQWSALQWMWPQQGLPPAWLAGALVVLLVSPVLVLLALLLASVVMTPPMVSRVAQRRFVHLQRKRGASWWASVVWALRSTAVAVLALLVSMPLWLVPPLVLVLPPLIGGWLTYRVMAFDVLAEHASRAEREQLLRQHRSKLLLMGVVCGYLAALPSVVWASGVVFAAGFWLLIPLALWLYAWVLALAALWFAHYGLAALYQLRGQQDSAL